MSAKQKPPMNRQRAKQLALKAIGLCEACGKERHPMSKCHCLACARKRRRYGRKAHGIIAATKSKRGRPTLETMLRRTAQ